MVSLVENTAGLGLLKAGCACAKMTRFFAAGEKPGLLSNAELADDAEEKCWLSGFCDLCLDRDHGTALELRDNPG
jgi:hypothetical protein